MALSDILSVMRPYVVSAADKPGLFRTIGGALLGKGILGNAMMALPQMKNFGKAFDTAGDYLRSPIANDFAMMNGMPPGIGALSMTGPMEAYAAKLRAAMAGGQPNVIGAPSAPSAAPGGPSVPLPQPRPMIGVPLPPPRPPMPGQSVSVPMPQANPLRAPAQDDNNPYGFVTSPGYMGQGSTRPANGLFAIAQMFKNSI